jgi:hypothetical protein
MVYKITDYFVYNKNQIEITIKWTWESTCIAISWVCSLVQEARSGLASSTKSRHAGTHTAARHGYPPKRTRALQGQLEDFSESDRHTLIPYQNFPSITNGKKVLAVDDILAKAKEYQDDVELRAKAHELSAEWHRWRDEVLGNATIIVSGIVGSAVFGTLISQLGLSGQDHLSLPA